MSAEPSLPVWEDETSSSSQNQQHNAAAAAAAPAAAADQPGSSSSQNFYPEDPHVVSRRRQQQQQQQPPPPPQIVLADDADQVLSGNDFDQPEDPTSSSGSTLATRNDYGPALPSFVSAAPPEPVVMGPVLPPNFAKPDEEEDENSKSAPIGPVLPPSDSSRTSRDNDGEDGGYDKPSTSGSASNSAPSKKRSFPGCDLPPGFDLESNNTLGPSLPPGFEPDESPVVKKSTTTTTTTTRKVIGPALPPDLLPHFQEDGGENEEPAPPEGAMYGMELPPGFGAAGPDVPDEEDEDGEDEGDRQIGPSLPGENEDRNYVARLAAHLDAKKASEDGKKTQREAWMLEPPKALSAVGLKGATQFSQRSYSSSAEKEGRNAWTATPNGPSTSKEESNEEILERTANQARDEKQRKEADRLNAKRSESLYDQHAKGRKTGEGEKNALKPGERRPFDREKDMQGSLRKGNAEEARARMAQLASRFATGKQQQFL